MTKEQEIYQNMRHRVRKYRGKWCIGYAGLYCAIKEAGFTEDETIWKIMDNMVAKGYLRYSKDRNRRTHGHFSNYIILKWAN